MKTVDNTNYLTITELAHILGRSESTIRNWYNAAEYEIEEGREGLSIPLPKFTKSLDNKGTRYWKEETIPYLEYFRDNIKRGELAAFNRSCWGERGRIMTEKLEAMKIFEENYPE